MFRFELIPAFAFLIFGLVIFVNAKAFVEGCNNFKKIEITDENQLFVPVLITRFVAIGMMYFALRLITEIFFE